MKPIVGIVLALILASSLVVALSSREMLTSEAEIDECTAGVADSDVTVDGRPLLWKLRNESDETNDIHYFESGVEHYPGLGPATYSYLGMGPATDAPGPVRQGLNAEGLAVGWNVLDNGGWRELHHQSLGHFDAVGQVRAYIDGLTDLSTFNYFADVGGEAALWENQLGVGQHWEYNTRAPSRDSQGIDVDNADGDGNPWTGIDITYSGWVVRANGPAHYNTDGSDDLLTDGRYGVGRDVVANLIYNDGGSTGLSAASLARDFFRHDNLAINTTVSNMIVHGVLPTEDPRLSTMWTLLGHSETGIFVPVWLHGVESGGLNALPRYLNSADDGICAYEAAKGMYNAGYDTADVQARTLPFEAHLFQVVNDELLPEWRAQDWTDPTAVAKVGAQMKRVQEQMDADAYAHLEYLYENGASSNHAPTISIDASVNNGLAVTFSVTADDIDGASTGQNAILIDFSSAYGTVTNPESTPVAGRYWNTVTDPGSGRVTDALWSNGSQSIVDVVVTNAFAGYTPNGSGAVLYPAQAQRDGFFAGEGSGYSDATAQLEIRDLDPNKTYSFRFFGSRNTSEHDRTGEYTIGGVTVTLDAYNNTDQTVSILSVAPDATGTIVIDVQKHAAGDGFAYLNVLEITEVDAGDLGLTTTFHYGDGQIGSNTTHMYAQPGRYLVSCTATDGNGVSQTDWRFINVSAGPSCNDGVLNQGEALIDCGGPCPACACLADSDCSDGLFCSGVEMCDAHGQCQGGSDPCSGLACDEGYDVCVAGPAVQYAWSMDSDPGWNVQGLWAWGQPAGGGGQYGGPDPAGGYTGLDVYGYNLSGDYENNLPETHLTSTAIDCTDLTGVTLHYRRWLNVEQPRYDHVYLRASNDGANWTTIWENTAEIVDSAWMSQVFDISSVADGQPTLYLRWTMGNTDGSWRYSGWNIDDVEIWATAESPPSNNAPVADDQAVSTTEDLPLDITLTASDDDGDPLSYAIVTAPTFGTLTGVAPDVTYTPHQDYFGGDSFSFWVSDGQDNSNVATVSVAIASVNDPPVADDQAVATAQDTARGITLTASDVDGDPLTFLVIAGPAHGVLTGTGADLMYSPNSGYAGPDSFSFQAHDGQTNSGTATVHITVTPQEPVMRLEAGWVIVGDDIVTVALTNTYVNPVVLCSVQYLYNTTPVLAQVSNIGATSFDVRLQDPAGGAVTADNVSYLVIEEGAWDIMP